MNARQKAKKLKKENKYLIDNWMPRFPKRETIKVTQIPTEHYKAKIRVHRRILEEDGMAYVKRELALQTARMLEERINVELCMEDVNTVTYCCDIYIAFE